MSKKTVESSDFPAVLYVYHEYTTSGESYHVCVTKITDLPEDEDMADVGIYKRTNVQSLRVRKELV